MNKNLILLIIVLITSVMIYFVFSKSNIGIIDTSHYEKTIDSLNSVVHQHDVKIDSLNKSINERTAKIIEYNNQLSNFCITNSYKVLISFLETFSYTSHELKLKFYSGKSLKISLNL
jgi:hypothetical protein